MKKIFQKFLILTILISLTRTQDQKNPLDEPEDEVRTKLNQKASIQFPTTMTSNIKSPPTRMVNSRKYHR